MRYLISLLVFGLVAAAAGVSFLYFSQPTIERLAHKPSARVPVAKNAYFQMLGLFSKQGSDPFHRGKQFVVDYEDSKLLTSLTVLASNKIDEVDITLPIDCEIVELCVDEVWSKPGTVKKVIKKYTYLLKRYRKLTEYIDYDAVVPPAFDEPAVVMDELAQLHKLALMEVVYLYVSGMTNVAVNHMDMYINIARHIADDTDNVMLKLMMNAHYAALLRTISHLTDIGGYSRQLADLVNNQAAFKPRELSLQKAIKRDYLLTRNYLKSLHSDAESDEPYELKHVSRYYNQQIAVDKMDNEALSQLLKSKSEPFQFNLKSRVIDDKTLSRLVTKDYASYIASIRNSALMLGLLKVKLEIIGNKLSAPQIASYLENLNKDDAMNLPPVHWHANKRSIYIKGLAEIDTALVFKVNG